MVLTVLSTDGGLQRKGQKVIKEPSFESGRSHNFVIRKTQRENPISQMPVNRYRLLATLKHGR